MFQVHRSITMKLPEDTEIFQRFIPLTPEEKCQIIKVGISARDCALKEFFSHKLYSKKIDKEVKDDIYICIENENKKLKKELLETQRKLLSVLEVL